MSWIAVVPRSWRLPPHYRIWAAALLVHLRQTRACRPIGSGSREPAERGHSRNMQHAAGFCSWLLLAWRARHRQLGLDFLCRSSSPSLVLLCVPTTRSCHKRCAVIAISCGLRSRGHADQDAPTPKPSGRDVCSKCPTLLPRPRVQAPAPPHGPISELEAVELPRVGSGRPTWRRVGGQWRVEAKQGG